jgi:hypothetical protein
MAIFSPQELLARLNGRVVLLAGGARDVTARHTTRARNGLELMSGLGEWTSSGRADGGDPRW